MIVPKIIRHPYFSRIAIHARHDFHAENNSPDSKIHPFWWTRVLLNPQVKFEFQYDSVYKLQYVF